MLCIIVPNRQTASPGSLRMDIVYNTSVNRCSMIVRASIVQNRTAVDND